MSLAVLDNVCKSYGVKPVLKGISWRIEPGDRVGLIGQNGCGKTTLFHLITGHLSPDEGHVHHGRRLNVGYLPQEPSLDGGSTVLKAALAAFQDLLDLQDRMTDLECRMSSAHPDESILEEYGRLRDRYEHDGGYTVEARARAILDGLGFEERDFGLPVRTLSGGQKNRLALGRILASQPDLLLLDEPTNHLDLDALEWIEGHLSDCESAFVVVSHDRYFLGRTVTQTVELEDGLLQHYAGAYSFYDAEKRRRVERQRKAYDAQQTHILRTEDFIRRNIVGQKTKQAQSRRRGLAKLERMNRPTAGRPMSLRFATDTRGGDRVVTVEGLSKSYDDRPLLESLDLVLWRGERLGIVGANGSGKSTFLKLLARQIPADGGRVSLGRGVQHGYYDQLRQDLDPQRSVLEEVWSVMPDATLGEVRTFLGAFLFSEDDVEQKVGSLSGGEQSRVALAKLMQTRVNLLLLDEPTNHLDIPSRVVLEEAIERFDGTVIAVSHDRYFLNRLVNRLLVIERGGWRLIEGNYEALQRQRATSSSETGEEDPEKALRKSRYVEARRSSREQERRKRRAREIEKEIEDLEARVERLDREMSGEEMAADWGGLQKMSRDRSRLKRRIEQRFTEWEAIEAQMADAEG